jgi:hypothetical protein
MELMNNIERCTYAHEKSEEQTKPCQLCKNLLSVEEQPKRHASCTNPFHPAQTRLHSLPAPTKAHALLQQDLLKDRPGGPRRLL